MSAFPQSSRLTLKPKDALPMLLAFASSAALVLLTLGIIFYEGNPVANDSQKKLRKISFVPLPPPPPPPVENKPVQDKVQQALSSSLTDISAKTNVTFSHRPAITNTTLNSIPEVNPDDYKLDFTGSLEGSMNAYQVEDLDERPRIVFSKKSMIPAELTKQGIKKVESQVEILIDRYGEAHIKRIVDPGYNEMVPVIRSHIDAIKFSTPLKNGEPVNAEYLFIIRFRVFK